MPRLASARTDIVIDGRLDDLEEVVLNNQGPDKGGFRGFHPQGDIHTASCAFVNGFDLLKTLAFVDSGSEATLYLGFVVAGMIGDVDGDGNPDLFTNTQGGCAENGDQRGIGSAEFYEALLDLDGDFSSDLVFLVTNNGVTVKQYDRSDRIVPDARYAFLGNSLEVSIPLEDYIPSGAVACSMHLRLFCSAQFDGMGDDFSFAFTLDACEGRLLVPHVSFPRVTLGQTVFRDLMITNAYYDSTVVISEVAIEDPAFQVLPAFRPTLEAGITILPTFGAVDHRESATIPFQFTPQRPGPYRVRAHLLSAAGDTLQTTTFAGDGRAINFRWIYTDLYPDRRVEAASPVILQLVMADSVEVDSVVLNFGGGGALPAREKRMVRAQDHPTNDRYIVTLDSGEFAERGLLFYPRTFNGPFSTGEPATTAFERLHISSSNITFPFSMRAREYRMISIPLEIPNNTFVGILEDDLGPRDPTRWRMFSFAESSYVEVPDTSQFGFSAGRAYWLISREPASLTTRPIISVSTSLDSSFVLTLSPGFNMMGNPFAFPVAWTDILTESGLTSASVEGPRRWNPDGRNYESASVIQPFDGYWVRNWLPDSVFLRVPPWSPGSGLNSRSLEDLTLGTESGSTEWALHLSAIQGDSRDDSNILGIARHASDLWDPLDQSELPLPPDHYVTLAFVHSSRSQRNGRFDVDYRSAVPAASTGCVWSFDVTSPGGGGAVWIEWGGLDGIPGDVDLTLVDLDLGKSVHLREHPGYLFSNPSTVPIRDEDGCRFRIVAGARDPERDPVAAPRIILLGNTPNPFSESTRIEYETLHPGIVVIEVMDVAGRIVAVPERTLLPAGHHEAIWTGISASGSRVPDGIYFYRIRVGDAEGRGRMIHVR